MSRKCSCSGSNGTDGNGDGRDDQRNCKGDKAGSSDCDRCSGGKKFKKIEPDDSNYRNAITKETIGIPVVAIGVPTVVDAVTIVNDTMENLLSALETSESLKGVGLVLQGYSEAEKYELIRELLSPNLNTMFVTPKDIDESVKRLSFTISEGLNIALIDHNIFA